MDESVVNCIRPGSSLRAGYAGQRVLFLDVDGVLNTLASLSNPASILTPGWPGPLSKPLLVRLGKVLARTEAVIVLSSTWRLYTMGIIALLRGLYTVGIDQSIIVGSTPSLPGRPRAHEIGQWLEAYGPCAAWAAVDASTCVASG